MIEAIRGSAGRRDLRPVQHRGPWLAWGFALQVVGVGIPVTVTLREANKDGVLGSITHYTFRLVWHEMLRSRADVALLVLGIALFVAGSVVAARPFVKRRSTLFLAVPLAATGGIVVLGAVALVFAAVIALTQSPDEAGWESLFGSIPWTGGGKRKRRR
jgi:hypothetical protein